MGDKSACFEMKGEQNHWGREGGDTSATPLPKHSPGYHPCITTEPCFLTVHSIEAASPQQELWFKTRGGHTLRNYVNCLAE